jgi:hypothetical protein
MQLNLRPQAILCPSFLGFGVQLDAFVQHPMGAERWERLWRRVDLMRLKLVRSIAPVGAFAPEGKVRFDTREMGEICRLLDELQKRGITTIWGIWSEGTQFDGKNDPELHEAFADAAAHLILQRGYSCIRYLNLFNEPNHGRSFRAGNPDDNYSLWADAIRHTDELLRARGVTHDRARIIGPHNNAHGWHNKAVEDLHDVLGAYATHVYPRDPMVRAGQVEAWRNARRRAIQLDPDGFNKPFIFGECGLYDDRGEDDRQWNVRKYWYGEAMADLAAQALRSGLAGAIYWMLDDAMHPRKLWGLWDSTGTYDRDGEPRPVAYAWTMLTRCFPPGMAVVEVEHEARESFRAAAARGAAGWSVLLVNRGDEAVEAELAFPAAVGGMVRYDYFDGPRAADYEGFPLLSAEGLSSAADGRMRVSVERGCVTVLSNLA